MDLITVIVPIYRVEKYIERCARSIFEQSFPNIEYLFLDDHSPDRSIDILTECANDYPQRQPSISIIRHRENLGIAATRNEGIEHAKGDFILFVDSDDWLERDAVRLLVEKQQECDYDIVSAGRYTHFPTRIEEVREPPGMRKEQAVLYALAPNLNHVIVCRLIKRSLFIDHDIRCVSGVNHGEDWLLYPKLLYYAERFASIDDLLYHYDRSREDSACAVNSLAGSTKSWMQEIDNVRLLGDFFLNKEQAYYHAIRVTTLSIIDRYMHLSAKYCDNAVFDILVGMLSDYVDCFDAVGWSCPLVRRFATWYRGRSVFIHVRSFGYSIFRRIFKRDR